MATTKYLSYEGLQSLLNKLFAREFKGMGLSHVDFTQELKEKYDALVSASSAEELTGLFNRVSDLEKLIEADSDGAINKFNEIVTFIAGIGDDKTLSGMMSDIASQIADAKKAGTDAAAALETYKTANDTAVAGKVDKVDGKGLSTNDYTNADKAEVAKVKAKLDAADVAVISTEEIESLLTEAGV